MLILLGLSQSACRSSFVSLSGSAVQGQAATGNGDAAGSAIEKENPEQEAPLCLTANLDEEESNLVFIDDKSCPPKKGPETPDTTQTNSPKDPPKNDPKDPNPQDPGKDSPNQGNDTPNQGKDKPNQSYLNGEEDSEEYSLRE